MSHEIAASDEDIEVLANPIIDVAQPVLEELSLALDPYPRAEGATFTGPREQTSPAASPFAVLESLNRRTGKEQPSRDGLKPRETGGNLAAKEVRKQD